ncbi:hypothetical protein LL912_01260 [Niabella sp. CC-SYL272]|uniref:hypothetical protein n=1 Tax=Niabella agricola TaxID=2891571 RepID=UPI001F1D3655|nr:hypothetical protein [Niabella agricola]MCF3107397.1 hypothetical protein [Niabella agricola]
MNFFRKLFGTDKPSVLIKCPRCLGKGRVDQEDIRRLKQELIWSPGSCAYCNGTGTVDPEVVKNVPPNACFLITNLPEKERKKILNGHPDALERGRRYEEEIRQFIEQISYLHFKKGLNALDIAGFFLTGKELMETYETEKQELLLFIEEVVQNEKRADKNGFGAMGENSDW